MHQSPILTTGVLLSVLTLLLPGAEPVQAFPEPSIVSRSWQFDFTHQAPRPIAVPDAQGRTQWYWYLTYKVTNNTGAERMFVPSFTVADDQGGIHDVENPGTDVFKAIQKLEKNPLLERPDMVVDKMLQGEDYARESVIVWPARHDTDVVRLSIFISGLSGETAAATDPVTGQTVTLRKALMLDYDLPGKPQNPQSQSVVFREEIWVMR